MHRLEIAFRLRADLKNKDGRIIFQEVHHLNELINEVKIEIEKLRSTPLRHGCRIGGEDSNQYVEELLILIEIVEKSKVIVIDLKNNIGTDELSCKRKISELELFTKQLQFEIKKLEMIVASGDNSTLIKRIEELENSIFHLKNELTEKEDNENSLKQEILGARIFIRHNIQNLKSNKTKIRYLINQLQLKDEEIKNLKLQHSSVVINENFQLKKFEIIEKFEIIQKFANDVRLKNYEIFKEMNEIRNFLLERMKKISKVLREKSAIEEELKAELEELREENAGLKSSMQLYKKEKKNKKEKKKAETFESDKQVKECGNSGPEDLIENVEKENRNLKVFLKNATATETINILKVSFTFHVEFSELFS